MQVLLIAATEKEIQQQAFPHDNIDLLITGAGIPATIYHLQKRLHQIDYDLVIQAGIAGSFDDNIQPGQAVLVQQDRFGDLGTEEKENFKSIFEAGLADENEFPFESGWLINKSNIPGLSPLPKVKAVTVNKISDSILQKQQLISLANPQIESMEGAALHYVCLQENIPFIQLRAISNFVGERDRTKWLMNEAIENLNNELRKLIALATLNFKP